MEEKVFFKDVEGHNLCGILTTLNPEKIVILAHGHGLNSSKNSYSLKTTAEEIHKKNISTLRLDVYGHGESDGKYVNTTIKLGIENIKSALNFVLEKGFSKIAFFGSSFGGMIVLYATLENKNIKCIVLRSPTFDYFDGDFSSPKAENFKDYQEKHQLYNLLPQIKVPILMIYGDQDDEIPQPQFKKGASLFPNCKVEILENEKHSYTKEGMSKAAKLFAHFIEENL